RLDPVLGLGATLGGVGADSRRQVDHADGRLRLVAALPSGSRGPVELQPALTGETFDLSVGHRSHTREATRAQKQRPPEGGPSSGPKGRLGSARISEDPNRQESACFDLLDLGNLERL